MTLEEAYKIISAKSQLEFGKFYQAGSNLSLGVGKLFYDIRYPQYNLEDKAFDTYEGTVFILTHECDVAEENNRPFSDHLIFCPIIPLEALVAEYAETIGDDEALKSFLSHLAVHNVSRVIYLPPCGDALPYGGVMYLNQITNTHRSAFPKDASNAFAATTGYGLRVIDMCLTNHLLRPKSETLAFST